MKWSDAFKIGSSLIEAGAAIKSDREFKQRYPEDYVIHQELATACLESKFDFKLQAGAPVYASSMFLRGVFNVPSMRCTTFVNPEAKLLEVVYEPAEAVFVRSDERVRMLLNWVNTQLNVGRFYAFAPKQTLARSDLVQLGYRAALPYAGVDKSHIRRLAGNLFQELVGFYDMFIPTVKALSEQKVSFDENGILQGPAAAQITSQQSSTKHLLSKAIQQGSLAQLLTSLQQHLDANKITWEPAQGHLVVKLKLFDEVNDQAWHYAYVTDLAEVVFEAQSRWTVEPDRRLAVIGSKYLLFLNFGWTDSGAYFLDLANGQMVCRAGFSAQRMEKQLPAALFTQLTVIFTQMAERLGDLRQVAEASVRGRGEVGSTPYTVFRGATDEEVGASVSAAMAEAGDPRSPIYMIMRRLFHEQVGAVLEDVNV